MAQRPRNPPRSNLQYLLLIWGTFQVTFLMIFFCSSSRRFLLTASFSKILKITENHFKEQKLDRSKSKALACITTDTHHLHLPKRQRLQQKAEIQNDGAAVLAPHDALKRINNNIIILKFCIKDRINNLVRVRLWGTIGNVYTKAQATKKRNRAGRPIYILKNSGVYVVC